MTKTRFLLTGVAAIAIVASGAAHAQDAGADKAPKATGADESTTIVVTGVRQSLRNALDVKRKSSVIVDAVSAEDVGKFPDTNVAETLQRVPGVSVDHLFGDGERVSILGTDPSLNRSLLDGQTIASVGWYTQDTPSRTFNYTLLAPEVVQRAEIYRSSVASIEEGSIGGTVIVRTRKPLDLKSGLFQGSIGETYMDLSNKTSPSASLLYNWRNASHTFGVIIAAQHFTQDLRRDGIESAGVTTGNAYLTNANSKTSAGVTFPHVVTAVGANASAEGPTNIGSAYFTQTRQRDGANIGLQWRPTSRLELDFDGLYTKEVFNNINQSLYGFMSTQPGAVTALTASNGVLTSGTFADVAPADCGTKASKCVGVSNMPVYVRQSTVETYFTDLKAIYNLTDTWKMSVEGGKTRATGGTDRQLNGTFVANAGYTYSVANTPGNVATLVYNDPTLATNASKWTLSSIQDTKLPYTDEETFGQIDFKKTFDGVFQNLQFGAKFKDHETTQVQLKRSATVTTGATAATIGTTLTPGNFLSGLTGASHDETNHILINTDSLVSYVESASLGDYLPVYTADFDVREKIANAYVQSDFKWQNLRGNIGVRYARTQQDSAGYVVSSANANVATPVTNHKTYSDVLPSFSASYDLSDNWVARFSAAKVISRAGFGSLSSYFRLTDSTLTGTGGNPNLDPYRSTNYDASLEWYFAKDSYLSVSPFYRDISNYILSVAGPEDHYNSTLNATSTYTVTRPENAGPAKSKGYSLSYQQTFDSGLGVTANYTYVDAAAQNGQPLPYASKNQISVSPFYEKGPWSVRASYTWRSSYFTGYDTNSSLYTRAFTQLDASADYSIDAHLQLTFNASNILNSTYYNYSDNVQLVRGIYKNGRRYMTTLRFKY